MTTQRIEKLLEEFDERFGGNAPDVERYLCLYNSALGYSEHHQVVRDFIVKALTEAHQAGIDEGWRKGFEYARLTDFGEGNIDEVKKFLEKKGYKYLAKALQDNK